MRMTRLPKGNRVVFLVQMRGFEPPRPFGHMLLRHARLPFRHICARGQNKYSTARDSRQAYSYGQRVSRPSARFSTRSASAGVIRLLPNERVPSVRGVLAGSTSARSVVC